MRMRPQDLGSQLQRLTEYQLKRGRYFYNEIIIDAVMAIAPLVSLREYTAPAAPRLCRGVRTDEDEFPPARQARPGDAIFVGARRAERSRLGSVQYSNSLVYLYAIFSIGKGISKRVESAFCRRPDEASARARRDGGGSPAVRAPALCLSTNSPLTEIRDPNTRRASCTPPQAAEPLPLLRTHGAGESGSRLWDIISEGATGTPPVELHFGRALPALAQQFCVVAPQTSAGWPAERVRAFMRFLLGADSPLPCRIDQSRCYVTGHSMGGSGALVSWA